MLIIDCHAHIYSPDEKRYQPKDKPLRPPKGKGSVEDLRKESLANGVSAVRAIQTVTFYGFDNRYLIDSARANKSWLAGVCNLDPDDPHSPLLLREFVRDYGIKSVRCYPSAKHKTFDDPGVRALWKMAMDEGATVDIFLMQPAMVESASKIIAEFPRLTIGFCHCMDLKPGPALASNLDHVRRLSRFKNLYPKVDFIGTGTNMPYPCSDLHDAAHKIIDAYGPERCVWASVYPNALWTPRITYAEQLRIFTDALGLKEEAKRWILGETARKIWFPHLKV